MVDKFRKIFESAPDAIVIVNAEGKIHLVNSQTEKLFGYTRDELIGKGIELLMPTRYKSAHQAHIKSFSEKPKVRAMDVDVGDAKYFAQRKNGEEFPVAISLSPLELTEGFLTSVAIRDVSKQKQKEKELIIANRKLVFENEEKEKRAAELESISEKLIIEHDKLVKSETQIRNYATQLNRAVEEERTSIAREIHDELGQQLTALKMNIDWVLHKQPNAEEVVLAKLQDTLKMTDNFITTIRKISFDLRPAIIDDLGLLATLEWKCSDFQEKMGIPCKFNSQVKERKFEDEFSINTYRILQETLTNISRHAQAKSVIVSVSENEKELFLEISDDGKGISNERAQNGKTLGIIGMKERAALLGGKLTIEGAKNKGTRTQLILPFKNEYVNS
ncbi:MAG TPA: PAS domain S-box protein [Bacteroidia bacterium]